jgi:hypothetical protein
MLAVSSTGLQLCIHVSGSCGSLRHYRTELLQHTAVAEELRTHGLSSDFCMQGAREKASAALADASTNC